MPGEFNEYFTEGMKWLAIGGVTYISTLIGLNLIPTLVSKKN